MQVNIILVPDMVPLDLVGPYEVLSRVPGWTVDLVAATPEPVRTGAGLAMVPTRTRDTAAPSELLVAPGGGGIDAALGDPAWLGFVARHAARARIVLGICTGALLLGAAGLLTGRRAGSHWQARDLLAHFGAVPSDDRVTVDGPIYTSAGVSSGIDAALRVVAELAGEERARRIQLALEHHPAPPFPGGTPATAPPALVERELAASTVRRADRERRVIEAADRLRDRRPGDGRISGAT